MINFDIHDIADTTFRKIGARERLRDEAHVDDRATVDALDTLDVLRPSNRERNSVKRDLALLDDESGERFGQTNPYAPLSLGFDGNDGTERVDMAEDDVPAEECRRGRGVLEIDARTHCERAEARHTKRLRDDVERKEAALHRNHGQAATIDRNRCPEVRPVAPTARIDEKSS